MSIIYEKVDLMILNKRLSLLEQNINSEDFRYYIKNDSLLEEYLSNKDITKIFLDVLKNAKNEMKLAKKYKKENNIKEAKLHLQKADKFLEEADKNLNVNRYSGKISTFMIGNAIYILYHSVLCFITILPGLILEINGIKQISKSIDNIDRSNRTIENMMSSVDDPIERMQIAKFCIMMANATKKEAQKVIKDVKIKRSLAVASQLTGLLALTITKIKKIKNLKWSKTDEVEDKISMGANPYIIQIRIFINDFRKIIQKKYRFIRLNYIL